MTGEETSKRRKPKSSLLTGKESVLSLSFMLLVGGILFTAPSSAMAQQQQTTGTAPTTEPLTPKEQLEQDRLQRTTAAITQNLEQGQKQVNGIVYTPRWSEPVWVQSNALSLLFVYCLPGEYAESGQEILGGSELEVLESYSLAVTSDLTGWLMIVQNRDEIVRLPAAVGVICASDANDPEARTLNQQEQIEINNIIQQFITVRNTVINNVTQIINIINNVTTNGTGGPVTPPPTNDTGGVTEPPTNDTGGVTPPPTNDTGGVTEPPTNDTGGVTEPPTIPPPEGEENVTTTAPPATTEGGVGEEEPPAATTREGEETATTPSSALDILLGQ